MTIDVNTFKTPKEVTNVTVHDVSSCISEAPKLEVGKFEPFQVEVGLQ